MQKPSRRHHYVPQFYLNGFAGDHERPRLFTVDLMGRKNFYANPLNIALKGDFHTVEVDGHPPDLIETALSDFEGAVAPALARTVATATFASSEDKSYLLTFATLLLVKHPRMRAVMDNVVNAVVHGASRSEASDAEAWEIKLRGMIDAGEMPPNTDIEALRHSILSGDHTIKLSTGAHLEMEFEVAEELFPLVAQRKWNIYRAVEGEFVTCDRPVALSWADPTKNSPIGLGLKNTRLLFPLSPTVAISGGFELRDATVDLGAEDVAKINGRIILHAGRQVYARDEQFQYSIHGNTGPKHGYALQDDAIIARKMR